MKERIVNITMDPDLLPDAPPKPQRVLVAEFDIATDNIRERVFLRVFHRMKPMEDVTSQVAMFRGEQEISTDISVRLINPRKHYFALLEAQKLEREFRETGRLPEEVIIGKFNTNQPQQQGPRQQARPPQQPQQRPRQQARQREPRVNMPGTILARQLMPGEPVPKPMPAPVDRDAEAIVEAMVSAGIEPPTRHISDMQSGEVLSHISREIGGTLVHADTGLPIEDPLAIDPDVLYESISVSLNGANA